MDGAKLAALRDQLVMTQEELAPRIDMTKNNLSRLENLSPGGMNKKSFRMLAELASLSTDELKQSIAVVVPAAPPKVETDENRRYRRLARQAGADGSMRFSDALWLIEERGRRRETQGPTAVRLPGSARDTRLRAAAKTLAQQRKSAK